MATIRDQGVYEPSPEYRALLRRMRRPYLILGVFTTLSMFMAFWAPDQFGTAGRIGMAIFGPLLVLATFGTGWIAARENKRDYEAWCERTGLVDDRWRMR